MELLTTREFNCIALDCYKADNEDDGFWATREQIGRLLGYNNPRLSVANIHNRNKERFDKFSRVIKTITHEKNQDITREVTFYNFKGFLEICRFSNQPNANAVIDFAWVIMDEIRRTGSYNSKIEVAKVLLQTLEKPVYPLNETDRRKIFSKAVNLLGGIQLDERFYTVNDIAKELHMTEKRVFNEALSAGIIEPDNNIYGFWDKDYEWLFNERGREKMFEIMPKRYSHATWI